jgi:uncharacterized membrane protein YfcA
MRGIVRTLDEWVESKPWLTAAGAGLVVGSGVFTIEWVLDDSPDWLFPVLLTLTFVLMVGFKGQAQRRQRRQG